MFGLSDIRNFLASSFSKSTRKVMDVNPHFVPLSLKALNISLGSIIQTPTVGIVDINLSKFRNKILSYIKGKYKNSIILTSKQIIANGTPDLPIDIIVNKYTPAIIYLHSQSSDNIVGVLYSSYSQASGDLLNGYLNKEVTNFLNESLGSKGKEFDLAYILENDNNDPISVKVKKTFNILNMFSQNTVTIDNVDTPNDKGSVLQNQILVESLLESYGRFHTSGPRINATIEKDVGSFIKRINASIVIIQDQTESANIAKEITSASGFKKLSTMLANTAISSKSFLEDIKNSITARFLGRPSAVKRRETGKINTIDLRKGSKVNVSNSAGINSRFTPPTGGMSVVSLQNLLNEGLYEKIRANMGDGSRTDVLNYRTGRLAKSFKVTAVSRERSGAITAFYSYMKFPYITFGPGGAQQNPPSRNPALLGDRSIRQLAVGKITSRLRTVVT